MANRIRPATRYDRFIGPTSSPLDNGGHRARRCADTAGWRQRRASSPMAEILLFHEALDEVQCRVGDLAPPTVDRQGVPAAGDLDELRDPLVALLLLERRLGDRPWHRVVALAGAE